MRHAGSLLLPLALLSACAAAPPRPPAEALRASLEKAELDFAASVAARGIDAWVDAFTDDGMVLARGGKVFRGHAAVRAAMAPFLATGKLSWHPTVVEVAPSGDMGFTFGVFEAVSPGKNGAPELSRGTFMTVWKRGADGRWKVAADHGSDDPPPPPAKP